MKLLVSEAEIVVKRTTYNAANTTETVDTNLDNHDCSLLEAVRSWVVAIDDKMMDRLTVVIK